MPIPTRLLALATALMLPAAMAHAIDFRSVSEASILYDAPSTAGKRLYIVAPGTPVEMVVTLDKWVKVRDAGGALTWIERRALAEKRTVIVSSSRAMVRQRAAADAPVAFEAIKDVVLELGGQPADGWLQVRHKDGVTGFVRVNEVWGL